jgi:hypothetical protein
LGLGLPGGEGSLQGSTNTAVDRIGLMIMVLLRASQWWPDGVWRSCCQTLRYYLRPVYTAIAEEPLAGRDDSLCDDPDPALYRHCGMLRAIGGPFRTF